MSARRRGFTLVELLVVIALLAILASVGGVATVRWQASRDRNDRRERVAAQLAMARRSAIRLGRAITVAIDDSSEVFPATALPDGRVVVDAGRNVTLQVDRATP